jgi:adenosylhomocysteine nucleosidase
VPDIDREPSLNADARPPGMIAVTFALPEESKDFVAKLQGAGRLIAGALPVITGELGGRGIVVCHTGVGAESCNGRIAAFLQEHRPASLISSGFAGGLDPALKVGDIIIAGNFSNEALLEKMGAPLAVKTTMTTQAQVAERVADKAALFSQTGAAAVDMETAIISGQCAQLGIPMVSLRGISDSAADELTV